MANATSEDQPARPTIQEEIDLLADAIERQREEIENIYNRLNTHDTRITNLSREVGR